MTFDDLLDEIESLQGLSLKSLGRGSNISIISVNRAESRVELKIEKSSLVVSRSFKELKSLWSALAARPYIHVDSVLQGSGSSRNQPETILANLPFVEFLVVNRRKHICLLPTRSHEPGTIKEMDPLKARELVLASEDEGQMARPPALVIVSGDLAACVRDAESIYGDAPISVGQPGAYTVRNGDAETLLIDSSVVGGVVEPGCYPVIGDSKIDPDENMFSAGSYTYAAHKGKDIVALKAKKIRR